MVVNIPLGSMSHAACNISQYFNLPFFQSGLDFVDVVLNDDNELFIDPRLIENSSNPLIQPFKHELYNYFGNLIVAITSGNSRKYFELLKGLKEPKETRLGYGKDNPNGNSVGSELKLSLIRSIVNNPVIQGKSINSFSDLIFFIPQLSSDRISDITTKVLKPLLIQFTQIQCNLLGIPMKLVNQEDLLDFSTLKWHDNKVLLPVFSDNGIDKPIIFVPKDIVNLSGSTTSNINCFFRFARNYIIRVDDHSLLKNVPRNGKNNSILVQDFNNTIEDRKPELSKWVLRHPQILKDYWVQSYDKIKPLDNAQIEHIVYANRVQASA